MAGGQSAFCEEDFSFLCAKECETNKQPTMRVRIGGYFNFFSSVLQASLKGL